LCFRSFAALVLQENRSIDADETAEHEAHLDDGGVLRGMSCVLFLLREFVDSVSYQGESVRDVVDDRELSCSCKSRVEAGEAVERGVKSKFIMCRSSHALAAKMLAVVIMLKADVAA